MNLNSSPALDPKLSEAPKPALATVPPKLQPPGAGLPLSQSLYLRFWLGPVVSKRTSRFESRQGYELFTSKILSTAERLTPEQRRVPVLVAPIQGLEDSSRFWSYDQLLEHLLIVSQGIESVVLSLASGKVPDGIVSIANFKPRQRIERPFEEFQGYAPGLLARLDAALAKPGMNANSPLKFRHPWLGRITAHQWYWLLAGHQGIHWKQAKAIVEGLQELSARTLRS